ncbi:uncharacterized protein LOC114124487 isoform X3 [Aphis gossypii]|uniref:uncharacterized protein LOC114124487 isoform X2 n=1 Tax=Aphis gossypii TaxID=80765 RepID=UPI00100E730A|nr:uncharacterized protein LOC114124487 isoform X2 [Aphis gossypii]XP_027843547.1 uncharacterized protein LOC114124487 isoform X4 [Aphis gossypii]XP_050063657.1 uncharacterized protein LOC114124487 isoform X3 [Aphis gossypii]
MCVGILTLFLLKADPAEREYDGGIDTGSNTLSSRWSRLQLYKNEDDAANNVQTVKVSKDTIYAMMQRGVIVLNAKEVKMDDEGNAIDDSDDDRWARECMERICAELDSYHPNVISVILMINEYFDTLEKMMDQYEEQLSCYNNTLALLTENRLNIEKDIKKKADQCKQPGDDEKVIVVTNDESSRHWKPLPVPIKHTIVMASRTDDDFLTIFEQFKKAQEEHHKQ